MKRSILLFTIFCCATHLLPETSLNGQCKYEIAISFGAAQLHSHPQLYNRALGLGHTIRQYTEFYQGQFSSSGEFAKISNLFPINLNVNYNFSKNWFAKAGLKYSFGKANSKKNFPVVYNEISENYQFELKYGFSNITPYVGMEKRFSSFSVFANLDLNLFHFSNTEILKVAGSDYWYNSETKISARHTGPGITIGGKYFINLKNNRKIFIKLEYTYLNISRLSGTKNSGSSDSAGNYNTYATTKGKIYSYIINPYQMGAFDFWDMHESAPDSPEFQNIEEMSLDLSTISLSLGFSF